MIIYIKNQIVLLTIIITTLSCNQQETNEVNSIRAELFEHSVLADGHPIAVWEKSAKGATEAILLVHGRTWSALPDFDLQVEGEDLSLMDGLVEAGYAVFAIDMRGYGGTPRDETGWLTPNRAADDLAIIVAWIDKQNEWDIKPHLFGWSMGSTNSHLMAQKHPDLISSLTLFGFWKDLDVEIEPYQEGLEPKKEINTVEAAASDFIVPGSISKKAIDTYVKASLAADPIRVDYKNTDQYNQLDPLKIITPTLIIQGELDPVGPTDKQVKLYTRIGTAHKQWVTVPGGDHAAFLETPRAYFLHSLVSFLRSVSLK